MGVVRWIRISDCESKRCVVWCLFSLCSLLFSLLFALCFFTSSFFSLSLLLFFLLFSFAVFSLFFVFIPFFSFFFLLSFFSSSFSFFNFSFFFFLLFSVGSYLWSILSLSILCFAIPPLRCWWERCPISSGDDTQVEVQGCTGKSPKFWAKATILHLGSSSSCWQHVCTSDTTVFV